MRDKDMRGADQLHPHHVEQPEESPPADLRITVAEYLLAQLQRLAVARAGIDAVAAVGAVPALGAALAARIQFKRAGLLAGSLALAGAVCRLPADAQARSLGGQALGSSAEQHRLRAHKPAPQPLANHKLQCQCRQRHSHRPK